jgi:hypothetical protein
MAVFHHLLRAGTLILAQTSVPAAEWTATGNRRNARTLQISVAANQKATDFSTSREISTEAVLKSSGIDTFDGLGFGLCLIV